MVWKCGSVECGKGRLLPTRRFDMTAGCVRSQKKESGSSAHDWIILTVKRRNHPTQIFHPLSPFTGLLAVDRGLRTNCHLNFSTHNLSPLQKHPGDKPKQQHPKDDHTPFGEGGDRLFKNITQWSYPENIIFHHLRRGKIRMRTCNKGVSDH